MVFAKLRSMVLSQHRGSKSVKKKIKYCMQTLTLILQFVISLQVNVLRPLATCIILYASELPYDFMHSQGLHYKSPFSSNSSMRFEN